MLEVNFGCDPEFIMFSHKVLDKSSGLTLPYIVPPAALIEDAGVKVTHKKDKKVLIEADEYQYSEDGAAIELQMNPTTDSEVFFDRIQDSLGNLASYASKYSLSIYKGVTGFFDLDTYWASRGTAFRNCVRFGCDADLVPQDYIERGLAEEGCEIDASKHPYRYCGGHIHMQALDSNPYLFIDNWEYAAILFDSLTGLINTALITDERLPEEYLRLTHYGKPGRVRLQIYDESKDIHGIEYRVMSNAWVHDKSLTFKLLDSLRASVEVMYNGLGREYYQRICKYVPNIYKAIITADTQYAKNLLELHTIPALQSISGISLDISSD